MQQMSTAILFEEWITQPGLYIGNVILNRPHALNTLSLEMVSVLLNQLQNWQQRPEIAAVVLQGMGEKGFCAGGDVRQIYQMMQHHPGADNPQTLAFFSQEYQLDYLIHTFGKPILCWGNGLVMGGGMGLMVGASHRIVTPSSRLAMPEITIGFYPDVGGTWFLPKLAHLSGLFLGLTGTSLNANDSLHLQLADYYLLDSLRPAVLAGLIQLPWQANTHDHALLSDYLKTWQTLTDLPPTQIMPHLAWIEENLNHPELAPILQHLFHCTCDDTWLQHSIQRLRQGSPSSAHLIFTLYQIGQTLSLEDAFKLELNVSVQRCAQPDFQEGVRALLIDKDQRPQWQPAHFDEITSDAVTRYLYAWCAERVASL